MSNVGMSAEEVRAALSEAARVLAVLSVANQIVNGGGGVPAADVPGRQVEDCIIEAAPGPADMPVSIRQLARLAGYSYTAYLRTAVDRLVAAGKLERGKGGVRRRAGGEDQG